MIDPSKDKFAYFKDNIQTAEDKVRPYDILICAVYCIL